MSHQKALAALAALAITTSLAPIPASALTFASFGFTGGTRFSLTGPTFTATETGVFTLANGINPPPAVGLGPFTATFTLTGMLEPATGSALTFNATPNNTTVSQTIKSLAFSIVGDAGSPVPGKNLLTGSLLASDGGQLTGNTNNATQSSTASLGASGTQADIAYSSDILGFLPGTRDMSFSLNNLGPGLLAVNGSPQSFPGFTLAQGDLKDFFADMSGNFSATPAPVGLGAVPEPGPVSLFCGLGAAGIIRRCSRRRAEKPVPASSL